MTCGRTTALRPSRQRRRQDRQFAFHPLDGFVAGDVQVGDAVAFFNGVVGAAGLNALRDLAAVAEVDSTEGEQ